MLTSRYARAFWLIAFFCFFGLRGFSAGPAGLKKEGLEEIEALLSEKASWTPAQAKLESDLIHAVKSSRGQPFAPKAKNLRIEAKVRPDGRILVDMKARVTPALLALIEKGGGEAVNSFPQFRAVRALVQVKQLEVLAASPDVVFVRRADRFQTQIGSITSQGDVTHRAAAARSNFGVSGAGLKVGVLSDSLDYLLQSQTSGDLGTVTALPGQGGAGTGEGTAMLEIIHDVAPEAQLYFATATHGQASFAQNILDLRAAGCDILVDDVSYFNESPFQDGIIAQAVNTVTANGALFFSAAGNSGNQDAGASGTWEGDFVDGGAVSSPIAESGRIHSFGSFTYNTVNPGGSLMRVDLFWSDPLGASTNDYDLFVLDSSGSTVLRSSTTRQTGIQDPYESIDSLSVGERIVIVKYSGAPRFLHLGAGRARLSISTPGATVGHSAAADALSVAAVNVSSAYPNAFTGGQFNPVEAFSSDGPRHLFYNVDSSPITPGNVLSSGGALRQKPDIAAADGGATSVPGFASFSGTSAAAPHAAAIAALVWSYHRDFSPNQVRKALTSTALDTGAPGVDRDSGAGIVMAYQALQWTPLRLLAPTNVNEGDGILLGQGQVRIPSALSSNLSVPLLSSDTSEVRVPASVTIFAGTTNTSFDVTIVDDSILDGTQIAILTAAAPGYGEGTVSISVSDNETATLSVSLPRTASEGDQLLLGVISVSNSPVDAVRVALTSSDSTEIQVPSFVTIPAGQSSAAFTFTVVDDTEIDGNQSATVTAHVDGWSDGAAIITVRDNENTNLLLALSSEANESAGTISNGGLVAISGTLRTNLTVFLHSSDPGRLGVPPAVLIPAGQTSARFDLTVIDNSAVDGPAMVTLLAQAPKFASTSATVTIYDDESPAVPSNPYPADLATDIPARLKLSWKSIDRTSELITNGGFETGDLSGWFEIPGPGGDHFEPNDGTIDPPSPDGPLAPYQGSYSALAPSLSPGAHWIYQEVSIPAEATSAVLSWAHRLRNFSAWTPYNQFRVEIQDAYGNLQAVAFATQEGDPLLDDWVIKMFDLSSYLGQRIRVVFLVSVESLFLDVHLDNVSVLAGFSNPATFDVYFGTNPNLSFNDLLGSTTNTSWNLPLLAPLATYYWKIVSRSLGTTPGPVWQFTTRGVDHFEWSTISSPKLVNKSFGVTVVARDEFNVPVTNFAGPIALRANQGGGLLPSNSGLFTNGVWRGDVAVQEPGSRVRLQATDSVGHHGESNPFDVLMTNDLALSVLDSPSPVPVGANLTYTLTIANAGPATATNVFLTNYLPANSTLGTFLSSQGSCAQAAGAIECALGDLAGGASAIVTITVVPSSVGALTNLATISRNGPDADFSNNVVRTITAVTLPALSVADVAVREGDAGTTPAVFLVVLSGNHSRPVIVAFATADGSARVGLDYLPTNGILTFSPNVSTQYVTVIVKGDTIVESNETFLVTLSNPINAVIADGAGVGTILDDDGLAGRVDHFAWQAISSPQSLNQPFLVTITAQDPFNAPVTNFAGPVTLLGMQGGTSGAPVALAPAASGGFTNGTWSGNVTVLEPATNLTLLADDGAGHQGFANPFAVQLHDDISVTLIDSPNPVAPGEALTYVLLVTNVGPSTAQAVTLTDWLPVGAHFVSAAPSQGACSVAGGIVSCNLGTLLANASAAIALIIAPDTVGTVTNQVTVARAEQDGFAGNNSASSVTSVREVSILVSDASVTEGNTGSTNAVFRVQLSPPSSKSVRVNFSTADASAVAGADYIGTNGVLVFSPGETDKTILVPVLGDRLWEGDENFTLNFFNPSEAVLLQNQALGVIRDDDPIPTLSISDSLVTEGDTGTTNALIQITASSPSSVLISVQYETIDETAVAPDDYGAMNGTVFLDPGQTNVFLSIPVRGDILVESNETFLVYLSNPNNATTSEQPGRCTILNDDGLPGQLHHFSWAPVPSPQLVGRPFAIQITAQDAFNGTVSNFTGKVALRGVRNASVDIVHVLTFTGFADTGPYGEYRHSLQAIRDYFPNFVETTTTSTDPAALQAQLADKEVFLVVEQESAPAGQMGILGAVWTGVLNGFVNRGGIVIVCSYALDEHLVLANSGLLTVNKFPDLGGDNLTLSREHPLATGVSTPFFSSYLARYSAGNGCPVLETASSHDAVVVARDIGAGHAVLIGTDFYALGTGLDRILANSVQWAFGDKTRPVLISPTNSANFTNGIWSSSMTVFEPGTNIFLLAEDALGRNGAANDFTVGLHDDLGVAVHDSPDPVGVGENLTYFISVTNIGPSAATGVTLTNLLPASASFVSVTASQGACQNVSGTITCNLGTLSANRGASVTVVTTPTNTGSIYSRVSVGRAESDPYLHNNSITNVTLVQTPSLSVGDTSVIEGDSGVTNAVFTVTLSPPTSKIVRVNYSTLNGSAAAGTDFIGTNGTLIFSPGETSKVINVSVLGDIVWEGDEVFFLNLSSPTNAVLFQNQAMATILNDDPFPSVSVFDTVVTEGDIGTTDAVFTLRLLPPSSQTVAVQYYTMDSTAVAAEDYVPVPFGTAFVTFSPGQTSTNITIKVKGDSVIEQDEAFLLLLYGPSSANLAKDQAVGRIINDDGMPGQLEHFTWSQIASTQYVNTPFPITITARDYFNSIVSGFNGRVALSGADSGVEISAGSVLPANSGNFTNGIWMGNISVQTPSTNCILLAGDDAGHSGIANPFTVLLKDDVAVSVTGSPAPVAPGENLAYAIQVTNIGPSAATGIMLTNFLPSGVAFISATPSQGSCSHSGDVVICSMGTLLANQSAVITIVANPSNIGSITNWVIVSRAEADAFSPNNAATNVTSVQPLSLSIDDTVIPEGNSGLGNASLRVQLSSPSSQEVRVSYTTADNSASAGIDYLARSGIITFAPGETTRTILVPVMGDIVWEPDESFFLDLSNPTNAIIIRTQAVCTISNDDPFPAVSISDAIVIEGNTGTTNATFVVSLFPPSSETVRVFYHTADATADGLSDYIPVGFGNPPITFAPGQTNAALNLTVKGDTLIEEDEAFLVLLDGAENAQIGSSPGVGLVLNDDGLPGRVDHFIWSAIASPQLLNIPFVVTLAAQDAFNAPVTNFNGTVYLNCSQSGVPISFTPLSARFTNGFWSGSLTVLEPASNMMLMADDHDGHFGSVSNLSVALHDDIGISITASPEPVGLGENVTYSILVTNTGPSSATGITLTNVLGSGATVVSVASSQGGFATAGKTVSCNLGTLGGNSNAMITLVATAGSLAPGAVAIRSTVARGEPDGFTNNNVFTNISTVRQVALSINDTSVQEGNSGTNHAAVTVQLLPPTSRAVQVNYSTGGGTAAPGSDYLSSSGNLTFAPGETNKVILVSIIGDIVWEQDETFQITLTDAVNAPLAANVGTITILNDDPFPKLFISDATVVEGDIGTTNAAFPVRLSPPSSQTITVSFSATDGSASAPGDFNSIFNGFLTFTPGQTSAIINVVVQGDTLTESDESFFVNLSNPRNADFGRSQAVGTILNDDGLPGKIDHFAWGMISSPQFAGLPFQVTLTAQDAFNNTITSVRNSVSLEASRPDGFRTNSILGDVAFTGTAVGSLTAGYAFTPNTNMLVTHFRYFFGTKISLWTDSGILLASRSVTNLSTTWQEVALTTPVPLLAGQHYRLSVYASSGNVYGRFDGPSVFADGAIDQAYFANGDTFPNSFDSWRWILVDLKYAVALTTPIAITPSTCGPFSNGIWTGSLAVPTAAANVQLRADDRAGHRGLANAFDVHLPADLSLAITGSPNPVRTNSPLTFVLTVFNPGPSNATSVNISNYLPAEVSFVSASASQGSCVNSGRVVTCDLGTLPAASLATVQVLVTSPATLGNITNRATVTQRESDPNPTNNSALAITSVPNFPPVVSLTAPADGALFQYPANILLTASAADDDGLISKIEFFNHGSKLGEATSSPFNFLWTNAHVGLDVLTANATDNGGKSAISAPITITVLPPGPGSGIGLYAEYYDNIDFTGFVISRLDPIIAFDWGFASPDSAIGSDTFSVRWIGQVQPLYSDTYTFYTGSDEGVRLYVNNQLIINNFTGHPLTTNSGTIALQAGRFYPIRMEYFEDSGPAAASLGWSSPNQPYEIIPPPQLNPLPVILTDPVSRTTPAGSNVTFNVSAAGQPPLSYQWLSNGVPVSGETSATLLLSNVQENGSAGYSVMVANPSGSITSAVATLTVLLRDSDTNGLPDDWEIANFGHIGVNPAADPDQDGMSNLQEYIAGTNPNDRFSVLAVQIVNPGGGALLRFISMPAISYTLQYRTNLAQGQWTKLRDISAQPGTNIIQVTDPDAISSPRRFYRLATPQQP